MTNVKRLFIMEFCDIFLFSVFKDFFENFCDVRLLRWENQARNQ